MELNENTLLGRVCAKMMEGGLITREQLEAARDWAAKTDKPLKEIVAGIALISPEDMGQFLEEHLDVPRVDLASYSPEPEAVGALPGEIARERGILPLFEIEGMLTVVMANPLDVFDLDALSSQIGMSLEPALVGEGDVKQAIEEAYAGVLQTAPEAIVDIDEQPLADIAAKPDLEGDITEEAGPLTLSVSGVGGPIELDRLAVADDETVTELIGQIVNEAASKGATTIHIEPRTDQFHLLFRIDGELTEVASAAKALESRLVTRLLAMARVDGPNGRGIRNGRFSLVVEDHETQVGLSSCSTNAGQRVVITLSAKTQQPIPLEGLGMYEEDSAQVQRLLHQAGGLILIGGPVHAGKTATLFACLKLVAEPGRNVFAVTEGMEYSDEAINQIVLGSDPSYTAPAVLRSLPEQDVNVLGLDEVRSVEVASLICKIAQSGSLGIGTTLARDASAAPATLIWYGLEPVSLAQALTGVIGQRAVPTLCPDCKIEDSSETAAKAMEPFDGAIAYVGSGCSTCGGTGTQGSIILYEVLVLDDATKRAIASDKPENEIRKAAKEAGMRTMRECGMRRAAEGLVSVRDVRRVTRHGGA